MSYRKLVVWQKSMELVKLIYDVTRKFPKEEIFGLTAQMRRSAVSVPSNIAEGSQRNSAKEFINFILIAKASLAELETQILVAKDQGYGTTGKIQLALNKAEELNKMLYAFLLTLRKQASLTSDR